MALRRRELRCCLFLACLFVVVVPTLVFGREYLQLRLPEISFSEVDVAAWVQEKFKSGSPPMSQDKVEVQKTSKNVIYTLALPEINMFLQHYLVQMTSELKLPFLGAHIRRVSPS